MSIKSFLVSMPLRQHLGCALLLTPLLVLLLHHPPLYHPSPGGSPNTLLDTPEMTTLLARLAAQEALLNKLSTRLENLPPPQLPGGGKDQSSALLLHPPRPALTRCHHGDWSGYEADPFPEVEWKPRGGKYLLAACYDGGYSNRMLCITYLAQVAAMTGRVLVPLPWPGMILPHQSGDEWISFDLASVIDLDYLSKCVPGGGAALSWEAFQQEWGGGGGGGRGGGVVEAAGVCFEARIAEPGKFDQPCGWAMQHSKKEFNVNVTFGEWVPAVAGDMAEEELMQRLRKAGDPDVLWVLGVHNNIPVIATAGGRRRPPWPYTPVARTCKGSFFQPTPAILLAAKRFVASYTGQHYAAIHLRRNDFIIHLKLDSPLDCQYGEPGCDTLSIPQLATCLNRALDAKGLSVLFVATDASAEEIALLKELLRYEGKTVVRVPAQAEIAHHRWYEGLPPDDEMVYALVEKTICAMSTLYISSFYSTFSEDIQRLRYDWGKDTCHDHLICQLE